MKNEEILEHRLRMV